jgi:hypothetical protein
MPNGVVTKGIVPPYPRALRCVPINVFTYDTASFWAARPESDPTVSMMRLTANLFMTRNCILHVYADAKLYDYSGESQLLFSDLRLTTS